MQHNKQHVNYCISVSNAETSNMPKCICSNLAALLYNKMQIYKNTIIIII